MDSIGPKDKNSFGFIMGSSMAIGIVASVIFHVFTKNGESSQETNNEIVSSISKMNVAHMTSMDWLKEPQTFLV